MIRFRRLNYLNMSLRGIMEHENSTLLESADKTVNALLSARDSVLDLLPTAKSQLPQSINEMTTQQSEANLLYYLQLRSLYALSDRLWKLLDDKCRALAECTRKWAANGHDSDGKLDIYNLEDEANTTINIISIIVNDYPELTNNSSTDLLRIHLRYNHNEAIKHIFHTLLVLPPDWVYSDLIEILSSHRLRDKKLLKDVLAADIPNPEDSIIAKLLQEKEEGY